jgi:site-specific DNA-methyltransferase (adenine-specific)
MTEQIIKHQTPHIAKHVLGDCASSEVYLMDCIQLMKHYPDKYFDLAVVDPPYGISVNMNAGRKKDTKSKKRTVKKWDDKAPEYEYFLELFRVSKNQIIWGSNYFKDLPIVSSWIFWDKMVASDCTFSDGELAWTSFGGALKKVVCPWSGFIGADGVRIHPTQKPIKLYDWIFKNYATEGMKVLDTHLGSGSSRISANKANLHFVGCEIDEEYFNKSCKRYDDFVSQVRLF